MEALVVELLRVTEANLVTEKTRFHSTFKSIRAVRYLRLSWHGFLSGVWCLRRSLKWKALLHSLASPIGKPLWGQYLNECLLGL